MTVVHATNQNFCSRNLRSTDTLKNQSIRIYNTSHIIKQIEIISHEFPLTDQ